MTHLCNSLAVLLCVLCGYLHAASPPVVDLSQDTARQVIIAQGTEAVKAVWQEGIEKWKKGTLEPMQLVKAVHAAEAKESPSTNQKRGAYLLQEFNRITKPE